MPPGDCVSNQKHQWPPDRDHNNCGCDGKLNHDNKYHGLDENKRLAGRYVSDETDLSGPPEAFIMGLMNNLLGGQPTRDSDAYVDLTEVEQNGHGEQASMQVHVAEISEKQDVIAIKDAVYDGDLVVADITRLRTNDRTADHIIEELRQVAEEVTGDIVKKGDDQLIITPNAVKINREKLD